MAEHNSSLSDINKTLFKNVYFRVIECAKNAPNPNYPGAMREFIRQSDMHCSEQNMTLTGSQNFKLELYEEYFKTMDNYEEEGLLSVASDSNRKKPPQLNSGEKQSINENQKKRFRIFLSSFKNLTTNCTQAETLNSNIKPINPSTKPASVNPGTRLSSFNSMRSTNDKKSIFLDKTSARSELQSKDIWNGDLPQKRPLKKIKFNEPSEISQHYNKKVCVQPKKSTPSEVGFVSASSMYRNPVKQASNESNSNSTKSRCDQDSNKEEHSELRNHETLKNFDKKIVDIVLNEIMDFSPNIGWIDIAGLEFVKTTVQEIVIWPLLRPDIFTGLRAPPRGILLFGPPGTGKTLIGKCIATESKSTFFCISASSLASKWVGESEQMVRALFAAARLNQPAVIFIDEIDSLLSQRSDKDQDFTRKLKTEFLVQFDGAKTDTEERVLVVGATNRPHELDEAARRRFVKRLYVPLPDESARRQIIKKLLGAHQHNLSDADLQKICDETDGYSGSDVTHLCKEAAMGPIRCIGPENIKTVLLDQVRPIALCDFTDALRQVRASIVADDLNYYMEWNKKFGSFGIQS